MRVRVPRTRDYDQMPNTAAALRKRMSFYEVKLLLCGNNSNAVTLEKPMCTAA